MKKHILFLAAVATLTVQALPLWDSLMPSHAQEVGKLYAAKPPQGSAFIRVISGVDESVKVGFSPLEEITLSGENPMTAFRLMKGGTDARISLDGQAIGDTIHVPEDAFMTILVFKQGGQWKNAVILDQTRGHDDLKAELRFYNLVPGCNAELTLSSGPNVFTEVVPGESKRRSINPVAADLQGKCAAVTSATLSLPTLKAGDRFSLFLKGAPDKPVLGGQIDQTVMPGQSE